MKVMTLVGTRPELIKLSRVIHELDRSVKHILVHTGQNHDYELNEIFFDQLEIRRPDHFLSVAHEDLGVTLGNILSRSYAVMRDTCPDALLLLGDTNSCLAAISAKRLKIPVFHMEAGNRCFDERVPEEINRRVVDHISDINLPYTEHARRYLIAEGVAPDAIIKTGSPMAEVLGYYRKAIRDSSVLTQLDLTAGNYIVVSAHREENVDAAPVLRDLVEALAAIREQFHKRIIFSTHPRTAKRIDQIGLDKSSTGVEFVKPLGFFDYIWMQMNAFCVISDSGTVTEESAILGFPAVTIRQAHERPEGMDVGTLVMSELRTDRILSAVAAVRRHHEDGRRFATPLDYGDENVSAKVVRVILGYTDFVNRRTWRKPAV